MELPKTVARTDRPVVSERGETSPLNDVASSKNTGLGRGVEVGVTQGVPVLSDRAVNVASVPQRSPLRYPGGKTWLVPRDHGGILEGLGVSP